MVVSDKKVVSLSYELRLNSKDGDVVEKVEKGSPLTFLFGSGSLLPKFEDNLAGLKVGESFDFNLVSEDAYGEFDERSVIDIPLQAFQAEGKVDYDLVKVGNNIPMQDSSGNRLVGVVKEIGDEKVKMDFNHPLAGQHLFFKGEITELRDATDEEIAHGHLHQNNSCGGGGCEGCSDEGSCCS